MISMLPIRYHKHSTIVQSINVVGFYSTFQCRRFSMISRPSLLFTPRYNSTVSTQPPSSLHGSYHWLFERFVAVNTLALLTGMIVAPAEYYPWIDFGIGFTLPLHGYLGISAVITDYLHRRKYPVLYPISKFLLAVVSILASYGLYQFNTNSIGFCALIRKLWACDGQEKNDE